MDLLVIFMGLIVIAALLYVLFKPGKPDDDHWDDW